MPENELDKYYVAPTNEYVHNSLIYGLAESEEGENLVRATVPPGSRITEQDILSKNHTGLSRLLVNFAYKNKLRIASIPVVGSIAISIKNIMVKQSLRDMENNNQYLLAGIENALRLEGYEYINKIFNTLVGRDPTEPESNQYFEILNNGARKEAIIYLINKAYKQQGTQDLVHNDAYRLAYYKYSVREVIKHLPIIGWIWTVVALPRRFSRVTDRLIWQSNLALNKIELINARQVKNSEDLIFQINLLSLRLHELSQDYNSLQESLQQSMKDKDAYTKRVKELSIGSSSAISQIEDISESLKQITSQIDQTSNSQTENTQSINFNITSANVKIDNLAQQLNQMADTNKPVIYGMPGGITVVQTNNYILGIPSEEWRLAKFLNTYGSFEFGAETCFQSLLSDDMIVIDVGANIGSYTILALKAGCEVYSYEPTPRIYTILNDNIGINGFEPTGRAHTYNLAASDQQGDVVFTVYPNNNGHNTFFDNESTGQTIRVKTVSLDEHLNFLSHVDVVKIDVEGAEPLVLRGMERIIRENPKIQIIMEFAPINLERGGTSPSDLLELIRSLGLSLRLINEHTGVLEEVDDAALAHVYSANVLLFKDDGLESRTE